MSGITRTSDHRIGQMVRSSPFSLVRTPLIRKRNTTNCTPYHSRRAPIKNESPSSGEECITRSRCEPYHLPRTAVGGAVLDSVSRAQGFLPHKVGPQVTKCETTKDHLAQNASLPTSFWNLHDFGKSFYILKPYSKRVDERWECSSLLRDKRRARFGEQTGYCR